jgi:hypothetical protein
MVGGRSIVERAGGEQIIWFGVGIPPPHTFGLKS